MVKILNGACIGTVVTSIGLIPEVIAGCKIIGEGRGASTGLIVLSDVDAYYIPQTSPDLTSVITQLTGHLTLLTAALTGIQASLVANDSGATSAAPVAAAIAGITTSLAALNALILTQR